MFLYDDNDLENPFGHFVAKISDLLRDMFFIMTEQIANL